MPNLNESFLKNKKEKVLQNKSSNEFDKETANKAAETNKEIIQKNDDLEKTLNKKSKTDFDTEKKENDEYNFDYSLRS